MRVTHDTETDSAYIYLANEIPPGAAVTTVETVDKIYLDFDAEGRVLGIEVLDATALLPSELLAQAETGRPTWERPSKQV